MKLITNSLLALFGAAALLSATPIQTVKADVLNVGSPLLAGNAYVGPYTLNVNGTDFAAMCIDFQDHATLGNSYSAYETQLGGSSLSNTYHPSWSTQYEEEAYLLSLILLPNADRIDIQEAAWAITDSNYKVQGAAQAFVNQAMNNYSSVNFSNFDIISGVDQNHRTQEFIIEPGTIAATPEPSTMLLMGGGLLIAGLAGRKMRKKA